MAERELAREAHHDVPGLPHIGEIQNEDQDGQQIVVGDRRRGDQRSSSTRNADPAAQRNARGEARDHAARFP
jgi:hypothetical protein